MQLRHSGTFLIVLDAPTAMSTQMELGYSAISSSAHSQDKSNQNVWTNTKSDADHRHSHWNSCSMQKGFVDHRCKMIGFQCWHSPGPTASRRTKIGYSPTHHRCKVEFPTSTVKNKRFEPDVGNTLSCLLHKSCNKHRCHSLCCEVYRLNYLLLLSKKSGTVCKSPNERTRFTRFAPRVGLHKSGIFAPDTQKPQRAQCEVLAEFPCKASQ